MSLLEIIENTFGTVKKIAAIKISQFELELNNKECFFSGFESEMGFKLSDELKEIYSKYKTIKLVWETQQTRERGYFEIVPFDSLYSSHKELIEISEGFINDDRIEDVNPLIEDLKNWIPIIIFPNGDAFCIDKRNHKIVFFEHDVFDAGANLHGLVIAENIDILIEEWSKVLFVDIYDWYEGVDENGIDLKKDIYKNITKLSNAAQE